jgi:threonylcarbamoyladenosine tRNA methylthiotransferase MtaB
VAIRTLGCKVNRTESEALAERLIAGDVELVDSDSEADVVVVNTCTVTAEADAKARKEVRRALVASAGPVVVTGCLAAVDPESLTRLDRRVVVGVDRAGLAQLVGALLETDLGAARPGRSAARRPVGAAFRTRVMVKVQDGCDRRCAYCIVPDARGGARSVPAAEVLGRVHQLAEAGTVEVVLTGINIGCYADPRAGVEDLADLVESLATSGISRLRVSSIEPVDLTVRLVDAMARVPQVVPHLHVPLQSGCDSTLAAMGRDYRVAQFASTLERARSVVPGLAVATDVMVGFPSETDEDFAESLAFVEASGFSRLHVFRYSPRSGTPASARGDRVSPAVKAHRAAEMRALSDRLAREHVRSRTGGVASVLVERGADGVVIGTTEDGLRVRLDAGAGPAAGTVRVVLRAGDDGSLFGEPLEPAESRTQRPADAAAGSM